MKYLIFSLVSLIGFGGMLGIATRSATARGILLAGLIFSTAFGDFANINFMSMETYRGPDRGFEVTLTDLIAGALIIAMLIQYPKRLTWFPYNSGWMLGFFGLACVSTLMAPQKILSAFTLFKFVRIYGVYWCTVNCLRTRIAPQYIWWGLLAIGSFTTLLAMKQMYVDGIHRIPGPFDHSNTLPLYLNLMMPLLLMWGLCARHFKPASVIASVLTALGMTCSVVLTYSRAGMLLAGAGLLGTLTVAALRARSIRVTATLFIVFVAMLVVGIKVADNVIHRFLNAPKSSSEARAEFNQAAAMMVRDHKLGVGINNFSYVLTHTPKYRAHIKVMRYEKQAGVVHHIYWLTAAETGYLGLAVFVIMIARFAWRAGWYGWHSRSLQGILLVALFLGFCTLHASGFLEWAARISPVTYLFAITAGISVGFADIIESQDRARSSRPGWRRRRRLQPAALIDIPHRLGAQQTTGISPLEQLG